MENLPPASVGVRHPKLRLPRAAADRVFFDLHVEIGGLGASQRNAYVLDGRHLDAVVASPNHLFPPSRRERG